MTARDLRLRALLAAFLLAAALFAAGCGASSAPEETPHVHVWQDGVCTLCGETCAHAWRDGVCAVCGEVCAHEWRDGVCAVCGAVCEHAWQDGVCALCGMVCAHESHGGEDLLCAVCGMEVPHSYLNGVCTRCGAPPSFLNKVKDVPKSLTTPAETHGTTETYHFALREGEILPGAHGTVSVEDRRQRDMVVYTPPGYDPQKQYDVVIIAPGAGHNAHYWMERANRLGKEVGRIEGHELLDRLIEQGLIEPTIIVVVEYYLHGSHEAVAATYGRDLRGRVLPFLAANYSTYASVSEDGELVPAPEHFALVGASFGAMVCWQMLPTYTDLFSYWGLLAGAFQKEDIMTKKINEGVSDAHPIHWLYAGDGENAPGWQPYKRKIEALSENCACLETDENLSFVSVKEAEHNFSSWDIGLINCLQIFFRSRFDPAASAAEIPASP